MDGWVKTIMSFVVRHDAFFTSLLVLLVFWLIRRALMKAVDWHVRDHQKQYFARKTASYVLGFLLVVSLWAIWIGEGLAQYLAILSAGIAIALQDPLANIAGWIFITLRRPFEVGDRVAVGQHAGDVVDVRLFQFSLVEIGNWVEADQSTGRLIHVPNGQVFKNTVCNYTQGFNFIWNELPVLVTFESDWKKAKEILTEIAQRHTAIQSEAAERQVRRAAQRFLIHFQHLTPIVWTEVKDSGVRLTIRYLCDPRRRRSSAGEIWEDILDAFSRCDDIDFAYPTQRFYDNHQEGKPGSRK